MVATAISTSKKSLWGVRTVIFVVMVFSWVEILGLSGTFAGSAILSWTATGVSLVARFGSVNISVIAGLSTGLVVLGSLTRSWVNTGGQHGGTDKG